MLLRRAVLIAGFILAISSGAHGQVDSGEVDLQGDVANLCTVLKYSTNAVITSKEFVEDKAAQLAADRELLRLWSVILAELQTETGVPLHSIDPALLASVMAEIEAEAQPPATAEQEEEEGWTAYDISRTALAVASIADPTGTIGVAAAYTYPKCGSEEARKSSGGFCWKDSYGRSAGTLPANFGRAADCPAGYTNNGLTCGRNADNRSAPSRVADCPEGYSNVWLTCFRPASTYPQGSRMADCPEGYHNMGATCHRWWPPHSLGMDAMSCGAGEFRTGGRCYKDCKAGYTNTGEFCGRDAHSMSAASAMTCPTGYFLNPGLGRCYQNCPEGYTNTGEFCFRGVSTLGLGSMTCRPGEFFKTGRCYDDTVCGSGGELDGIGLCYPRCSSGFYGVGPVCWSACEGNLGFECGAGCAGSSAECGLATTDMVASPLEMVASIVTLSGYSAAKSARKAAMLAATESAKAAAQQGAKAGARRLDDLLAAAAKAGDDEAAEAVGRDMTRQLLRNAKRAIERTKRSVEYLKKNYPAVRQKLLDTVYYTAFVEKAKAGASETWTGIKAAVAKKPPLRPGWEFGPEINPGLGDLAKALFDGLMEARKKVGGNNLIRTERLARSCAKAGLTIEKAALE